MGKHPAILWRESELPPGTKADIPEGHGIALCTGARSGVVVLDFDYKPAKGLNGLEEFARICNGDIPITLTVATPSGGFHMYFRHPGWRVKNSVSELGPGIDVRGDGGMVVLPPSLHKSGGRYEFVDVPDGADLDVLIAPLPDWLAGRLSPSPGGGGLGAPFPVPPLPLDTLGPNVTTEAGWKVIDRATTTLRKAPEGRRNAVLFRICAELGDWNHVGEISLDDARNALSAVFIGEGWGDPDKTLDTMERGFTKGRTKERALVVIGPDHEECNNQAIVALSAREDVYVVGNNLARDTAGNGIAAMQQANLGEILSRVVDWRQRSKEGELRRAHPPDWAIREIYARGFWDGLRIVEGFSDVPVLRPDGTLATAAGYDPVTRVVLGASHEVTPMTLDEARELLADVYVDFPFADPSHRAALMCALLTPLAVHAFSGPIPMFLFEASKAGSGKSLLAAVTALLGSGSIPPVTMFTDNNEEMRNKITAMAQRPKAIALLDNVGKGIKLGGPTLCAVLTSPDRMWSDRLLGGNVVFEGKLSTVFYATGNNAEIGADMDRRICPIRLVPDVERPEHRTKFQHPQLLDYVQGHRALLTSAALTILVEYMRAGMPVQGGKTWGSYYGWHKLVVGSVGWAGYGTSDAAVEDLRDTGSEDATEGPEIVQGVLELLDGQQARDRGMSVQETVDAVYPRGGILGAPVAGGVRLRTMLDNRYPKGCTAKALGYLFREYKDQVYGSHSLQLGKLSGGYRRWLVK